MKALTNKEFIYKSISIHGERYDYSLVDYRGSKIPVDIICKVHGSFSQLPNNHLMGHGCKSCRSLRNHNSKLIKEFNSKHGERYDYSLVDYKGSKIPVDIICGQHGSFSQMPYLHKSGKGCPKCSKSMKLDLGTYIKMANVTHNYKYDYSESVYNGSNEEIKIICEKHGWFNRVATEHLSGLGCKICDGNSKLSKRELLILFAEIFNDKYSYDLNAYNDIHSIIDIKCKEHGWFNLKVDYHKNGVGCKKCNSNTSKGELSISKYLDSENIEYIREKTFENCFYKNKLRFDFYLPSYNMCIEYDGIQHFEKRFGISDIEHENLLKRDDIKNMYCDKNNIYLVRIPYYEFDNIGKILMKKITSVL